MSDRAHSTGRRALLAGLGATALMYLPVHANGVNPDADLLALEPEFTRRYVIYAVHRDAYDRCVEEIGRHTPGRGSDECTTDWIIRLGTAETVAGLPALEAARDESWDALIEIYEVARATRAQTLQGLCFKARVYRDAEMEPENDLIADILAIDAVMAA